jgi:hypothetical protein
MEQMEVVLTKDFRSWLLVANLCGFGYGDVIDNYKVLQNADYGMAHWLGIQKNWIVTQVPINASNVLSDDYKKRAG